MHPSKRASSLTDGKWVTPIPKNGDVTNLNNITPITLTPVIGKLLEKYINDTVVEFLETNDNLYKHQDGFRKNKSTIKTIHKLANDIAMAKNRAEHTIAIFLDVSKAFDTINHDLLLDKMNKIGIRGGYLKWFRHYLESRKQVTVNNWMISDVCDVVSGVAQGSVCGPTMFLIFVNDLVNLCLNSSTLLFADDTVIYLHGKNTKELLTKVQENLNQIEKWCTFNKLSLNVKKLKPCSLVTAFVETQIHSLPLL